MAETTGYAALTVEQLGTELERRGLPKSGKKNELVTRLEDDDAAQGGTAPENQPATPADAREAAAEGAAEPASGDDPPSEAEDPSAEPEDKPKRRRGSEVSAGRKRDRRRDEHAREAPRDRTGAVAVRAQAKYVRSAPRKARLVMDHIRGKQVAEARAILRHTPRAAATDIAKLLESAVANAENNFELDPGDLKVGRAFVDEGPTIKRYRPRALGRATPIHKRTSHMTITLTTSNGNGA
jgi:large subunit ribosomal protein L22